MKTMLSPRRHHYLARVGTFLIAAALVAGMAGCPPPAPAYNLTIASTAGGEVTTPGEGILTYDEGTVVDLVTTPDAGYRFVDWTGDADTIADVNAVTTTITMNGDCSVTANFVAVRNLTITSTAAGAVTAPGEGTFAYDLGMVVNLVATADTGYQFINWTGDVATIAYVNSASTTITMSGDYSITANFGLERTTGAFLDEVLITREPTAAAAIQQLRNDALDIFAAYGISDPALYAEILASPDLASVECFGLFNEFTFNPVGPTFPDTGKLNPFSVPEFREAMHWLIDRDYIAGDIMGGLGVPRYTCLNGNFLDAKERYPDLIAAVEAEYAHDPAKAAAVITEEMGKLGAVFEGGKWMYSGEPVELIFLIRVEDKRKDMGEYFAGLLEDLGFTVTRQYGTSSELFPIWLGDPYRGVFHVYTAGWINTYIPRDEGDDFGFFYTTLGAVIGSPLWEAYENDPAFYETAERLWNLDYASMQERRELFDICLTESMKDNVRMFLFTHKSFSPMRANVRLAHDLAGGVCGSWMWALTAHFVDEADDPVVGGILRVATPYILTNPWNPIAGTNWVYEMFPIRAIGDMGHQPDTRTGLRWAGRIEKAEVFVQTGLPVGVTNTEWCSLSFMPEIQVPLDAWADWDAENHEFLTAEDRFGAGGTTAIRKSVSYYPKDIFDIPLHDGSTLSMGDFILYTILQFDRAKPDSAIYDEAYVGEFDAFMSTFKGVKFITDDPDYGLIVEYYSDLWELDAELSVTTMFPTYSQGPGMWHTLALGIRAEEDNVLAFSEAKSTNLEVEWMSFISGASLPILKSYLDSAKAASYIPYEATMGLYVTEAEAVERWSNLEEWYEAKNHFWVANGPFYLQSADTTEKVIHLKRFEDYPDPMDRWLFLLDDL